MREKIYVILQKIYGVLMTAAFFGGLLPLVPFIIAVILGGTAGETLTLFLYKQYYPWVIALASIAVLIGLAAMYVGKRQALSAKALGEKKKNNA